MKKQSAEPIVKISNSKHQITNKFQISISNDQNNACEFKIVQLIMTIILCLEFWISVIVIYLEFVIWDFSDK